jgi:hypothetical protein
VVTAPTGTKINKSSTGNTMAPNEIQVGTELAGTGGASDPHTNFSDNQYKHLNGGGWYYQHSDGSTLFIPSPGPVATAWDSGQYTALRFTQRLADAGVAPSTGSVGDSYDNALAENLWSTIKTELIYWPGNTFSTRTEADAAIFRYIDGWYNPRRIQEGLDGLSPDEFEEAWGIRRQTGSATLPVESDES